MSINTRYIAAQVLIHVLDNGQSLTQALDLHLKKLTSPKDQAFVQALCYGVCRHLERLNFILTCLAQKPVKDTEVKALIYLGLYQLAFMRVKPHAAVSETVSALKKNTWAKALINALLRAYLRERETLDAQADQHANTRYSHPNWLIEAITNDWPEQSVAILTANNQQAPMVLRVNQTKISPSEYLELLAQQAIEAEISTVCPTALHLKHPCDITQLPKFAEGFVSIQDTAAQLAASLLNLEAGQRVLDVCAAPGGKTTHILELAPKCSLTAIDIDNKRMERVVENLTRLQFNAKLITADALNTASWWDGIFFERILLDAPCSALGVIRRHPDIKYLRHADDIADLVHLQAALLQAIWPLLAPNGLLVYATCSILKQENELQIEHFIAKTADAEHAIINAEWGCAGRYGRQILTGEANMDGFYYACLHKK
ncbi:MAG: 16S rRNA (cytosine(967)-C(5))-methyltransferase RsmB [Methylovulum sp.]